LIQASAASAASQGFLVEAALQAGCYSYDRSRNAFVLRQFHEEGFVNTYLATSDNSDPV
jgi:hypothetical protein